ncbi:hypothetical protein A3D11_00360 [Candidatus Peribacteria bacterium RIFCSPHIGHO2_02_FULL_49_16]|nr:MAG: hypothetical protein A2880_02570 [Candidatus Peribacteria bacterium RIFCSPHIGHO2_01_FULL_49_38]OGJ59062.1 MAG: hypothetical protein A3D11_00360 [Candidatus Peribacteria bacterium RIFCSPHIGHO2_02_FULL_49_16]
MDFDPHTLHQIIKKIEQQMRCPQCGKEVPVDFNSVEVTGNDFVLLRIRCETCDAYIVLHASLQGIKAVDPDTEKYLLLNASSTMSTEQAHVENMVDAIAEAGGSFDTLFGDLKQQEDAQK